jgi:hypothetical protein
VPFLCPLLHFFLTQAGGQAHAVGDSMTVATDGGALATCSVTTFCGPNDPASSCYTGDNPCDFSHPVASCEEVFDCAWQDYIDQCYVESGRPGTRERIRVLIRSQPVHVEVGQSVTVTAQGQTPEGVLLSGSYVWEIQDQAIAKIAGSSNGQ